MTTIEINTNRIRVNRCIVFAVLACYFIISCHIATYMRNDMPRPFQIMSAEIIKTSNRHQPGKQQYALKIITDDEQMIFRRLPGMYPTKGAKDIYEESEEFQANALKAALVVFQKAMSEGPKPLVKCAYKTCDEAMKAYQEWYIDTWKNRRVLFYGKIFIEQFKDTNIRNLTVEAARAWVEILLDKEYKYDTVRLMVVTASGMIRWLEEQDMWEGKNPFSGLMKRYGRSFPAAEPVKSLLTDDEIKAILSAAQEDRFRAARVFIEIARHTGLRPSEIIGDKTKNRPGINAERIDRENLTWNILVSKTRGRQFYRKIAIPRQLVTFITNEGINGVFPFTEWDVRRQINAIRGKTHIDFNQKIFRKIFAHGMEAAGAPDNIVNLHQGRAQYGVLHEHYLTDSGRAEKLCRPYINSMFGETTTLARVI
jgi:integrase